MKKTKTYSQKLRDPRWQKKRLEILDRDSWCCKKCDDDETELHVHHLKYNKDPWDTPSKFLITLCAHCHKLIESYKNEEYFKDFKLNEISIFKSNGWISGNRIMFSRVGNILEMTIYDKDDNYIVGFEIPEYQFMDIKRLLKKSNNKPC